MDYHHPSVYLKNCRGSLRDTDQPEDPTGSSRIGACNQWFLYYSIQRIHDGYADCLIRLRISISIASAAPGIFSDISRHKASGHVLNQEQELKVLKQNYEKWLSPRMSNSHGKTLGSWFNTPNWNTPQARNRATNRLAKGIPFIVGQGDCRTGVL